AVAYIQTHACRGIGVPDVACHLKVSRRLADLRFRQLQGRSILEAIRQCRLEEVRRLLVDTDLPIGVIGERCGYPNENYLKNLFKARFGLTMRDYRKLGL
ncbi:MAG: helix-turn-helix transcriptional regulator, partial [Kiritimatiellia bacterium]|nr:helix-turn-helix transcriptional regulator [Kiritimatiellia bacterium]